MSEKGKLFLQIALGFIIGLTVCYNNNIVVREKVVDPTVLVGQHSDEVNVDSERVIQDSRYKSEDVVKSTKTTLPFKSWGWS